MARELGLERPGGQGLDRNQFESGNRTIAALLTESPAAEQIDLVATWRDGAYEVWAPRGMIRFTRMVDGAGRLSFEIVEQIRENPIASQEHSAVATIEDELAAAAQSGFPTEDPNRAFIEPFALSYPHAYERIAQVFDSPRGPDLIVSPKCFAYGIQPGQHGALDVVQSRAPLAFVGPGVKPGHYPHAPRHVDIAPTIARLMGFPAIDGRDASGLRASERGSAPDVYLMRQDGRVLEQILEPGGRAPGRVYMLVFDGLSNSELRFHLLDAPGEIPNVSGLLARAAFFTFGSTVNFPAITWPSHSTILTGTWSGHHDLVNPTFYLRESRKVIPAQGNIFDTEQHLSAEVETLYEAFRRVFGPKAVTASIHEPQGRGADHAVFERRIVGDKQRLKAITAELVKDLSPRWSADGKHAMEREEIVDARGIAQMLNLFEHCDSSPPVFVAHEFVLTDGAGHDYGPHHPGLREALRRTDRRVGTVLETLRRRGLLDSTLFVITADHGMAAQRIELKANPAREPARLGVRGIFAEPMIYLRDMAVECARARDGRSLRVTVRDNDRTCDSVHPPIEGAAITLYEGDRLVAEAKTSADGIAALPTPATISDRVVRIVVEHADFNPRTLRADGSPITIDLRRLLYPDAPR